ncbi:uridine kinase [Occallatibacter savannae]|uniref:uridine kinase n=1 Tax=Occallatibacter savannae TaxID=1002691 RepID=UPI001EF5A66B|nr:uridine kinase [Occallatibacter savannae]
MSEAGATAESSPRLPFPPVVMGIAGASGSGKTTLAAELARELNGVYFPIDNYYRDLSHLPFSERVKQNFDDPALIESSLLAQHVAALARGEEIERPLYDFATHTRVRGRTEPIRASDFVLVEGLFALYYPELLPLYQFSVYIDTPDDICFERRMKRDTVERGRTPESVRAQYETTVRPSSMSYVRPSSSHADLVIEGTAALDWKVEQVLGEMKKRGLIRVTR